ncbi:MAG: hypothetical protein GYA23_00390 [Methanomicrobiales archaeon]|nr:hypothetical protein [Methanomicrobiales archaeon]
MALEKPVLRAGAILLVLVLVASAGCLLFKPPQEPVVGIWVWTYSADNTIYTDTFTADGTYVSTSSDTSVTATTGTWTKIRTNEYLVRCDDGSVYTWIYHPETDTITQPEYPDVPSYRQGKQPK